MVKRGITTPKATTKAKPSRKSQRRPSAEEVAESHTENYETAQAEPPTVYGTPINDMVKDDNATNGSCDTNIKPTNGFPANSKKRASPDPTDEGLASPSKKSKLLEATPDKDEQNEAQTLRASPVPSPPGEQATELDKQKWQGFCEIESEPAYFSVMIREMGAGALTVREVFSLDQESLAFLPQPIYGLVLLFRARQVAPAKQELDCPGNVWFANQMPAQNSCATLAMINILLNIKNVDIGPHLQQFRDFTASMTPYQRGQTLASWEFVKRIHNAFAKKMDMLEDDKYLAHKVKSKKYRDGRRDSDASDASGAEKFEENAHHFIAFTPIDGEVWKLDGMDAYPTKIGLTHDKAAEDWISIASETISEVMMFGGDVEYNIVALVQAPLAGMQKELCTSIKEYEQTILRLDAVDKEWPSFLVGGEEPLGEPISPKLLDSLGLTRSLLDSTELPSATKEQVDSELTQDLLLRRRRCLSEHNDLQQRIMIAMNEEAEENQKAAERRWDYGPVIKKWLEMLAENGYLEEHLDNFMDEKPRTGNMKAKGKRKKK